METTLETFTHTVNGAELRFAHLTPYDLYGDPAKPEVNGFVPLYRKRIKPKIIENLRALEYSREQIASELIAFDDQPVGLNTFIKYVGSDPVATVEILRYSFKAANPSVEFPKLDEVDANDILWKILKPLGIVSTAPDSVDADPEPKADSNATFGDGGAEPDPLTIPPTFSATPGIATVETEPTTPIT